MLYLTAFPYYSRCSVIYCKTLVSISAIGNIDVVFCLTRKCQIYSNIVLNFWALYYDIKIYTRKKEKGFSALE